MIDIRIGDCLAVMPTLPENSVDSVICDPPYGLDFMGKSWDHGVPGVGFWQAALRVAKPGCILLAFGGTRTEHRLTCAIEDAGWEIRDKMCYLYGSGFPKSMSIGKAIDKMLDERSEIVAQGRSGSSSRAYQSEEQTTAGVYNRTIPSTVEGKVWQGHGTALKPAWEPIIVAMKPLEGTYAENAQKWGVAGLWIEGGRIRTAEELRRKKGGWESQYVGGQNTKSVNTFDLHPEGISGRWPANLLLDETSAALLDQQSGELKNGGQNVTSKPKPGMFGCAGGGLYATQFAGDHGGASRFFYTAKASSSERNAGLEDCEAERDADRVRDDGVGGDNPRNRSNTPKQNFHPTVKPLDLMRYLCKLTRTPTGGVVLDPFMGSGTTGIACILEHRDFIGIEIDEKYAEIAKKRIADMEGPLFSGEKYGE